MEYQREEGELKQSPCEEISSSSEENVSESNREDEETDTLNIKPPQLHAKPKSHSRKHHRSDTSHRYDSKRYREDEYYSSSREAAKGRYLRDHLSSKEGHRDIQYVEKYRYDLHSSHSYSHRKKHRTAHDAFHYSKSRSRYHERTDEYNELYEEGEYRASKSKKHKRHKEHKHYRQHKDTDKAEIYVEEIEDGEEYETDDKKLEDEDKEQEWKDYQNELLADIEEDKQDENSSIHTISDSNQEDDQENLSEDSDTDSTNSNQSLNVSRVNTPSKSRSVSPEHNPEPPPVIINAEDNVVVAETLPEEPKESKIDESLPPYYPAIQGCRSVEEFQCLNHIEEGTYGVVFRAKDKRDDEIVALKRLKMEREKEGFPITSLREINTLLKGQHPNIVTVREIVVGSNMDKIFIVMDYIEHDLKSLMETMKHKKQSFTIGETKCLMKQLLCAVAFLHDNWILHRDLKPSNLLLSHKGILKVGDFGLAREYGSPLKAYTPIVVTLWYRAPELLLCTKLYTTSIDVWSVGCIFAEFLLMNPLFPGKSEVEQINRIFRLFGTPNEKIWPGYKSLPAVRKVSFKDYPVMSNIRSRFRMLTQQGYNLLLQLLTYNPEQRITAEDALQHFYFNETPLAIDPSMFPKWPAKSELGKRRALAASPKPPSGGKEFKQLTSDDGFHIGMSNNERRLQDGGGFTLKF